jgi:prevent-host-death family protein
MKRVSITVLKNKLSQYLRLVKKGETIEVLERSVPVARIEGIRARIDAGDHLQRLLRDGIVQPARKTSSPEILKKPPIPCSLDAVKVLLEQRGER